MLKNRLAALAATAALVTVSLTAAGSAMAEPAKAPAKAPTTGVAGAGCPDPSFPLQAKESVKIRKTGKMSSTALGLLPKGKKACFIKEASGGKTGSCTKGTYKMWNKINYRGVKGWVPSECLKVPRP
ncbi:SH3 domain-containing protein [Streptomyces sp. NPDC048172]|uniref:SH3 domain-containing protein n=1 Tax=Streptomyces sp. NPDC048172 TaxID=3365505 RepID=UPI00371FB11E